METQFDWVRSPLDPGWIAVGGDMSDADIAAVIATAAANSDAQNEATSGGPFPDVAAALRKAERLFLFGGFIVYGQDFKCEPSCCCDLGAWREWYQVMPGGTSPFLGHDPSPWVECRADCAVIWADEPTPDDNRPVASIAIGYDELDAALARAAERLAGFRTRLDQWLARHSPADQDLAERFAKDLSLPEPAGA